MDILVLTGNDLTIEDCSNYLTHHQSVKIADTAVQKMQNARTVVEKAIKTGKTIYGVNTGFGKLADVRIENENLAQLQINLVRSHAAGVGEPLDTDLVRLMMLLKANALAKGYSGNRPVVAQRLVDMLNNDIRPVIPSKGSVGASGDLAPLAHLALCLIGEGEVAYRGRVQPSMYAFIHNNLKPVELQAKEGLAVLNGTQVSLAAGILAILRLENIERAADIIGALSVEALKGTDVPFRPEIHQARGLSGQSCSASNLYRLLQNSEIHESHRDCGKVQDMYSLRCMPQVHGASRDVVRNAKDIFTKEANASTDNPVVLAETNEIISGGNFHAEPVGMQLDSLAIAVAEFGSISERRIAAMMDPQMSQMPAFLTKHSGLESGFMLPQVTAAALVSENKVLAHPSTVDSIPTSANQEDHVSMAPYAGRKLLDIIENVEIVLGIELLCAAQGIDLKEGLQPAEHLQPAYALIREHVPEYTEDRVHSKDIEAATHLIRSGELVNTVNKSLELE